MFSNWKDLNPLKFLSGLFNKPKKPESPWLEGLDSRLASYVDNPMEPTTYKSQAAVEAEDQLRQLCNEVQEVLDEENDRVVVRKERRQNSTTSVDLKAWWGQSVATWDPIDEKNIDSVEQGRRRMKAKWFDRQPGGDLGRPH